MRSAALIGLLLGPLSGCRSAPPSPAEIEAALQREARCVVRDEALELYSPYDVAATEPYSVVARHEAELVRALLDAPAAPPVRLYLVPTHDEGEVWEPAARDGFAGGAFARGFAFAYVRADPASGATSTMVHADVERLALRHELAHVYARRTGLTREKWFDEGLARTVETMLAGDDGLHARSLSPALIAVRGDARPGSVAELFAWTNAERLGADELLRRYDGAQALLAFLLERAPGATWIDRVRSVHGLDDARIRSLEPDWLAWLADLDVLATVRVGAASASDDERAAAAALLPILAERHAPELATRAADELALALLADQACFRSAATFLLFFRARALDAADLVQLERSGEPALALTAHALRAKRGEPVDLKAARAAWASLGEPERSQCAMHAVLLPELVE